MATLVLQLLLRHNWLTQKFLFLPKSHVKDHQEVNYSGFQELCIIQ